MRIEKRTKEAVSVWGTKNIGLCLLYYKHYLVEVGEDATHAESEVVAYCLIRIKSRGGD